MSKLKLLTKIFMCIAITTITSTCFADSVKYTSQLTIRGESMFPTLESDCVYDTIYTVPTSTNEIEINDIITFTHENSKVIKRVIGLPGDVIQVLGQKEGYMRNGIKVQENFINDQNYKYDECLKSKTYIVPENCLFVLGDNRERSYDSREYDYPFINIKDVTRKVIEMKFSKFA